MKRFTKILSVVLAAIMALSTTTVTAFASSYNTVKTAESIGIGTTNTTFKYGYPDGTYKDFVTLNEKYFSFVPNKTGYYEFSATGYENSTYKEGKTPGVIINVKDSYGKSIKSAITSEYTLETKTACQLTAGQTYYIELYDSLYNLASYANAECGYAEQTIALTIAPHSHTLKTIEYSSYNYIECLYCDYSDRDYNVASLKSVKLSQKKFTYNGKVQTPVVIAYDSEGNRISNTAYVTSISGNKKSIGKYTVTVSFGSAYNYKTVKLSYYIVPKGTSVSKITAKKKGFTVKWKKQKSNTSGYVVKYSTNSKMKKAKTMYVSGNKKTKKSISGLKKGKKYYVQLATYKSVKGTKVISKYSKTKTVKVK